MNVIGYVKQECVSIWWKYYYLLYKKKVFVLNLFVREILQRKIIPGYRLITEYRWCWEVLKTFSWIHFHSTLFLL